MTDVARSLVDEGSALYRTGERSDAIARWEQAAALLEKGSASEHARVLDRLSVAYREAGRWDRARITARHAVARAEDAGDPGLALLALGHLGDVHLVRGEYDEAEKAFEQARRLAEAESVPAALVGLARRAAEIAMHRGDRFALKLARAAIQLAHERNQVFEIGRGLAIQAVALAQRGRNSEVEEVLERARQPARQQGNPNELNEVRLLAARAWLAAGRVADALSEATRAAAYAEEIGNARMRMQADAIIAQARTALRGETNDKLDKLLDLIASVTRLRDPDALMDAIGDAALDLLDCDRSFVIIVRDGDEPRVASARARGTQAPGDPSMSIVRRAVHENREVIATDLVERGDLREAQSVASLGLLSVICVPLVEGREVIGAIYADSQRANQQEFTEALRYVRALAANAAVALTNLRHLQNAKQRAEQSALFAHDIRSPVTAIVTLAEMLREAKDDPAWIDEVAAGVAERGRRVMDMAERFLDERRETWSSVDVDALTRELFDVVAWDARRKGVVIEQQPRSDAAAYDDPAYVLADYDALARTLTGLLVAGIKRAPTGSTLRVRVELEGDDVVWQLTDDGPPLASALRSDSSGRGVSLAVARRMVDEHGGRLVIEDRPGGGASFTVRLPHIIGVSA